MTRTHLYEHNGVTLRVDYTIGPDGVVCFEQICAIDANYASVGQDLAPLFESLYRVTENFELRRIEAESFLSVLVTEIVNARDYTPSKPQ